MEIQDFEGFLTRGGYRFLDFGCSEGGSIEYAYKMFDNAWPGLGIDVNAKKIETAQGHGYDAINFDIMNIPNRKLVDFVTMSHVLEHLPDLKMADQFLRKSVAIARKFVFIRQPFFDADGWLAQRGLKLYWADWQNGHKNKMTSLDFYLTLNRMKSEGILNGFSIYFRDKISTSDHPAIHPINSPGDQHSYQLSLHPPKKMDISLENTFREIFVLVYIDDVNSPYFKNIKLDEKVIEVR